MILANIDNYRPLERNCRHTGAGDLRSGLDVVRTLALGAKMVMIGRPWVYALIARQKRGVKEILEIFAKEARVAVTLSGCAHVEDINAKMLENRPSVSD